MRAFCRATRTPACKEYDALKAKLGRGDGPASSVPVSGELFVTKRFDQMKKALFFGDFLLGHQKKVTRPPGRDPAAAPTRQKKPSRQRSKPPPIGFPRNPSSTSS